MQPAQDSLIGDIYEPVMVHEPEVRTSPFIFASPHSGRCYEDGFLKQACAPLTVLRRSEDAYVDQFFSCVTELGASFVEAVFPRAFVDPNRGPDELDARLFDGVPAAGFAPPNARTSAGLGVIPRLAADGRSIHPGKIDYCEGRRRLDAYYRPYHEALKNQIRQIVDQFGHAVLIDCHSMPSSSGRGADIVLGDRFGASCGRNLINHAEAYFKSLGFAVTRNRPYAGGYTTEHYGQPLIGVHVMQVEINRGLYLHEADVQPSSNMANLTERLQTWAKSMIYTEHTGRLAAE
ncbi:N-formylglutamate amidohydrolase [Oceanicaulis sp. LC35]|uniref:N-formylglutamate amidohydrolase n=1 Tax=Oceanicaulis sp. LC35 TaxID=3349635 RepID=UPI003F872149